ncbi:DUF937 domain-containing protein [Microbacterium hibisci]|uniref:DUF937 domain-containing protein n=1 Tax=Microbacterium hibisci TaxID=2036000 RepID=UPI0027DA0F7F|nr:DUF937 domain-containing protein [Microbacterium hibisci]
MAGIEDILKSLPLDQIAEKLGVDPAVAAQAVEEGGATILSGLQRNAQTPDGAASIDKALDRHAGALPTGVDQIDTADGDKILGHIFGGQKEAVEQKLTDEPQTAGIDFAKLLPMLAPIVMGLLAKNKQGGTDAAAPGSSSGSSSGGGIGDLIGGLLGGSGGSSSGGSSAGGIDIGGLLGGLFGGKK